MNNSMSFEDVVTGIIDLLTKYQLTTKESMPYQEYTARHKVAFALLFNNLFPEVDSLNQYRHDTDKLLLYSFLQKKDASTLHRKFSGHHHPNCCSNEESIIHSVVDYECARLTKADKPLNAYETAKVMGIYEGLKEYLIRMGLDSSEHVDFSELSQTGITEVFYNLMMKQLAEDLEYLTMLFKAKSVEEALQCFDKSMKWGSIKIY